MPDKICKADCRPEPSQRAAGDRRPSGARGHLPQWERRAVIALWNQRKKTRGVVSQIAEQFGISRVAVSNIVLVETGKRPSFHADPKSRTD